MLYTVLSDISNKHNKYNLEFCLFNLNVHYHNVCLKIKMIIQIAQILDYCKRKIGKLSKSWFVKDTNFPQVNLYHK